MWAKHLETAKTSGVVYTFNDQSEDVSSLSVVLPLLETKHGTITSQHLSGTVSDYLDVSQPEDTHMFKSSSPWTLIDLTELDSLKET